MTTCRREKFDPHLSFEQKQFKVDQRLYLKSDTWKLIKENTRLFKIQSYSKIIQCGVLCEFGFFCISDLFLMSQRSWLLLTDWYCQFFMEVPTCLFTKLEGIGLFTDFGIYGWKCYNIHVQCFKWLWGFYLFIFLGQYLEERFLGFTT